MAILVVVAKAKHSDFILTALRGAFARAAVLDGKAMIATPDLLKQGISVLVKMPMEQALRVKASLVVFPEGCNERVTKKTWLVWKPSDSVHERDNIVEAAIQNLVKRKLLKPL